MKKKVASSKKLAQKKSGVAAPRLTATMRILKAEALLSTPHGATSEELRKKLGCERHTVMRAIRTLETMGKPVTATTEGRYIRYRIEVARATDAAKSPKHPSLTTMEAIALVAAEQLVAGLSGTGIQEAFASLVEKFEAALSPKTFKELRVLREKVVVVNEAPWVSTDRTDAVNEILTGLLKEERVSITGPANDGKERTFDLEPYNLVIWRQGLYVSGYSHHHGHVRMLGMDKVTSSEWKSGERFVVPETWNGHEKYAGAFGIIDGPETRVRLCVDPAMGRYAARRRWMPGQVVETDSKGGVEVSLTARGGELDIINWAFDFREHAVLVEPAKLRGEIARIARAMATRYEGA